ncbi:MAG TPA: ABC transporter permease subunit [Candidatus Binataceae bacterium]|nr:ABC transporter permease subunit [Candidatus Binataceae bacterium]
MSNGAATLEAARAAGDTRRAATAVARTGFSFGRMLAVTRKELRTYFAFPLVYIVSGIFALLGGWYAWTDLNFFITIAFGKDIIQNYWSLLFTDLRLLFILTLPFITMRSFAEERRLGTVELLYTYPLRDGEILGGKFLASAVIFLLMLALTVLYPALLYAIHHFPLFPLVAGYLGLVLLGFSFLAFGLFISSLCESQVVAGIATIALLLFLWILNWNEAGFETGTIDIIRRFSLFDQFGGFAKGVIDLDHVSYFVFFIIFFMFLTLRSMEARKWTGRR